MNPMRQNPASATPARRPAPRAAAVLAALLLGSMVALMADAAAARKPPADEAALASRVVEAETRLARGDTASGLRLYLSAAEAYPEAELAQRVTGLAAVYGMPSVMVAAAQRWRALAPADSDAQSALLEAQLRTGDLKAATAALAARVREQPEAQRGEALAGVMGFLQAQDERLAAEQVAGRLAALWPERAEAWLGHAQVAFAADCQPAARAALERLAALRPLSAEEQFLKTRIRAAGGQAAEALEEMGPATAEEAPGRRALRAQLLATTGRLDEARAALQPLAADNRLRSFALGLQAAIELSAGNHDAAARLYGELTTISPKDSDGLEGLADVAMARGDLDDALARYSGIQRGANAPRAQLFAWRLRNQRGDRRAAADAYDSFLAQNPELRADGLGGRAVWMARRGDTAGALALLDAALRGYPEHVGLQQARASTLALAGRGAEALSWYAAHQKARPWDVEAANNYAYQLALESQRLPLAEKLARFAMARRPVAAYQDTLGWVLYRRGRLAEARVELEQAFARVRDPEIAQHLGEVMWKQGEHEAAEAVWRAVLEGAEPDDAAAVRATARRVGGLAL